MKVYHALMKTLEGILTIIMALLVLIVTCQIFFRFVLKDPIGWSEQICRFLFQWATLLGVPCIFYEKNDMIFDIVYNKFSFVGKKRLSILFSSLGLIFSVFYLLCGWQLVSRTGSRMTAGVVMPVNAIYGAQVVCAACLFIAFAVRLGEVLKNKEGDQR